MNNLRRVKRMYPKSKKMKGLGTESGLVDEIHTIRMIFKNISNEVTEEQIPKEMLEALDKLSLIVLRLSSILKSEHERIGTVEETPPLLQMIEEATRVMSEHDEAGQA